MKDSSPLPRALRFGAFELDTRSRELRKQGRKIKLQGQPIDILVMLLERTGEVVTREELQKRLWPADTFVDFEQGLNAAIKRLRTALDDDAENPRFIETLPRLGYRFISPVDGSGGALAPPSGPPQVRTDSVTRRVVSTLVEAVLEAQRSKKRWRVWTAAVAITAMAVAVALVGLNVLGVRSRLFGKPAPAQIHSIAVLPLQNLSGDPEQEYLADGMTNALITELGKISALRVISRTSVLRYKETKKPLREIARELDVDALVEGAVQRSGDRVRLTANLIEASTDRHLWAEMYERDLRNVLSLQSDVATAIALEVRVKLTPSEQERLAAHRRVDPEAYEAYLKGRYAWHQFTVEGFNKSIEHYQQAIQKDPSYAQPYSGLADSYVQLAGRLLAPKAVMPKAKAAALRAVELDDKLAEGHASLGFVLLYYEWDWQAGDRELRRALELNPGYPVGHSVYASYLAAQGRHDEALAEVRHASELEPTWFGFACIELRSLYYSRRYDEAIEKHRKARELYPNSPFSCAWAGMPYEQKQRFDEAIAVYQNTIPFVGEETLPRAVLGHAYALAGKRAEAQKMLNDLLALSKKRFVSPYDIALVYIGLGEKDKAFEWLEKAVTERMGLLVYLNVDPVFDPLRSDPRFHDLLRRVGLPP